MTRPAERLALRIDLGSDAAAPWILAALVLVGLGLRAFVFRGFVGSDDCAYADLAHALAHGRFPGFDADSSVFQNRIGLLAPVAASIRVLGTSEWVFILYPFVISGASIALAYFFGRALFGTAAGLSAAAMIALLPIELEMASQLVPDLAAAFWANLGIFAIWRAMHSETRQRALALGSAAGLCFGVAWLHKLSVAYLAPFVGGVLLAASWKQPRIGGPALAGTALVSLAILAGESFAYLQLSGDAGFRLSSLARNFEQTPSYWFIEGGRSGWEAGHYTTALLQRLFIDGPRQIFLSRAYAHLPLAAVLVCAITLYTRNARYAFCGAWFLSLLLLFNFATNSLDYYMPLILAQRYLYPLVLPAALLLGGWLVSSLRRGGTPAWRLPISRFAVALLICLPIARGYAAGLHRELDRPVRIAGVRSTAELLGPADRIATDVHSARHLRILWGYPEDTQLVDYAEHPDALAPGSYVFVNRERIRLNHQLNGQAPPALWHGVPPDWMLLHRVFEGEIYRIPETPGAVARVGRR